MPPEESGIPPDPDEGDAYSNIGSDLGITDDEFAMGLLYSGWFDPEADSDLRVSARQAFFDYTGLAAYEFDWDAWRDWYSLTAA